MVVAHFTDREAFAPAPFLLLYFLVLDDEDVKGETHNGKELYAETISAYARLVTRAAAL